MQRSKGTARKGGAPRKAPRGLDKVLYVRADQDLIDRLEALRERRNQQSKGVVLSTADLARSILWNAVQSEDKEKA